jgi:hypothetical protein
MVTPGKQKESNQIKMNGREVIEPDFGLEQMGRPPVFGGENGKKCRKPLQNRPGKGKSPDLLGFRLNGWIWLSEFFPLFIELGYG